MPSVYFLSYARPRLARQQTADQVDRFERDLAETVSSKLGGDGVRVGFRDSCSIEAGSPAWSDELREQLIARPLGIVLMSPQYLERERTWCKWEYQFLSARNNFVSRLPEALATNKPRLLLVLDWVRTEAKDLPAGLSTELQRVSESIVENEDPQDVAAVRWVLQRGIWDVIKLVEAGDADALPAYRRFMLCLGSYLRAQWARWGALKATQEQHQLDAPVPAAYDPQDTWDAVRPTNAAEPAAVRSPRAQRRKVFVVYVAARPHEVPAPRAWRYLDDGEYDWRPFAGSAADDAEPHVGHYMNSIEGIEVREWQFDTFCDHMDDTMELAGRRYPVLFIVDPWTTTQIDRYRDVLQRFVASRFDQEAFTAPVVVWNDGDADSTKLRADFEHRVAVLFGRNRWEPSSTRDEFRETLDSAVKSLQRRIRNAAADDLPASGKPLPRISAVR